MDVDRQSELVRKRARETREHSDRLRRHATSERARGELLANRLIQTLARSEGRPHGDRGETFSLRLARVPQAVSLVRHELRRWLDGLGIAPEDALDIMLACSEACANAVEHPGRHGRLAFEVEARRESGELLVSVRDFGAWTPAGEDSGRGRGLAMIRKMMNSVEITPGDEGTQIVMHRTLHAVS